MRISVFATIVGLALFGTVGFAQSTSYDFDRGVNFSAFRTYAWTTGTTLADELNHARVVRAIESQLAAKGLSKVNDGAAADLLVAYHASFDKTLQINGYSSGWGPRFGGVRSGSAAVEEIVVGTVVVDLIDANTGNIVWRGTASGDIDPAAKPDKREKSINKAAQKVFKNYPPRS